MGMTRPDGCTAPLRIAVSPGGARVPSTPTILPAGSVIAANLGIRAVHCGGRPVTPDCLASSVAACRQVWHSTLVKGAKRPDRRPWLAAALYRSKTSRVLSDLQVRGVV